MSSTGAVTGSRATGDIRIDGLLCGTAWSGTVTYSFPDVAADYSAGYPDPAVASFSAINGAQRLALFASLDADIQDARQRPAYAAFSVEGFTDLTVAPAAPGVDSGAGILRAGNTGRDTTAYAYLPTTHVLGGDMWFGDMGRDARPGNVDYTAVLHEAGHALGLKHPHEVDGLGVVPAAWDSPEFTVMTYRPFAGGDPTGSRYPEGDAPQTYMMLDIAALQALYGADFTSNAGATRYSWDPDTGRSFIDNALAIAPTGRTIFQTVWDGGGRDVYDLSAFACDLAIDLAPGGASDFGEANLAWLGGGPTGGYARGSVFNALQYRGNARSLIEDAVGGAGDDLLLGNAAANRLTGGAGDDRLNGRGGADVMRGGSGNDTYFVNTYGERTIEAARPAGGWDALFSNVSINLATGIESLVLRAGAKLGGGNDLANVLRGNVHDNVLLGRAGNDRLDGRAGADTMYGGPGNDTYIADGFQDRAIETQRGLSGGWDTLVSAVSVNLPAHVEVLVLTGGATLGGGNARHNHIDGTAGNNILLGRGGNDRITGHGGSDTLYGGSGEDVFRFTRLSDSAPTASDTLAGETAFDGAGRARGDLIDLRALDADLGLAGNQAFHFGDSRDAGSLWAIERRGDTLIRGNVDGDPGIDFQLRIEDGATLATMYTADDFLL